MTIRETKDGGVWAYASLFSSFIVYLLIHGFFRSFTVLVIPLQILYDLSAVTVNYIPGIFAVGLIIGASAGSPILAILGNRKTMVICTTCVSIFCGFLYFLDIYGLVIATYFIMSVQMGIIFMASINQISLYWERKRTVAIQKASCGTSVGMLLGPPMTAWVIENYTVKGYYFVYSGIFFNMLIAAALSHPPEGVKAVRRETMKLDMKIFKLPELYIYFLSQFMMHGGFFAGLLYISPFAQSAYKLDPFSASLPMTIMGSTDLIFRIPIGIISDNTRFNRHYILAVICMSVGVAFLLMPFMRTFLTFGIVSIYSGIFQGGFQGLSIVTLSDILRVYGLESQLMHCIGIGTAIRGISCLLMLAVMGKIVELTGEYSMPFIISGGMEILAGLLSATIAIISNRNEIKEP